MKQRPKLLQFGGGNIGRSFVGQLFSAAGYEVVFADVDAGLIKALNRENGYNVEIRDRECRTIRVENARAVDARDEQVLAAEMADADICATAVGPKVLPYLFASIAAGLTFREEKGKGPVDMILCENLRDAAHFVREGIRSLLPGGFPVEKRLGLVETSIGKMVPLISAEQKAKDPLTVYAEAYNNLILDRKGFINGVPDVAGLAPKEDMKAYVDRKSFIHNLGHAALAYYSFLVSPGMEFTYEAVEDPEIRQWVKNAMWESGNLLIKMYPDEFNQENQEAHIEDLLNRFGNRALGDTIHRVGRDLGRKLSPSDRVAGPLGLNHANGLEAPWTSLALACGLLFLAPDPAGATYSEDQAIADKVREDGPEAVLRELCGLPEELVSSVGRLYSGLPASAGSRGGMDRKAFAALAEG